MPYFLTKMSIIISNERYYKKKDFNEKILSQYNKNITNGIIEKFIMNKKNKLKLCHLNK